MDSGLAAVIGAAVGAVGGLGASWFTILGQRHQQRAERDRWRDDMRRQAYTSMLDCCERLSAGWWLAGDALRSKSSDEALREERYLRAHELWTEFNAAVAAVSVAGPREVTRAAEPLMDAVYELDAAGTDWWDVLRSGRQRGLTKWENRFDAAMVAIQAPRAAFRQAVREALDTD
ncbi:hypothetical protein [Streptomyces sp. S.PNR 29]|uniref:hypothetical protein n=1 Tax=Streptomyces sp. S.PNR 29 TaxID=2973805 RepID=UPI0025AFE98A|nr:hypothetical protein [Streptomyces sp. S.PNR 29]MDN0194989.1 hypothetical protein [Streptomyces sp. S.PNR 29]